MRSMVERFFGVGKAPSTTLRVVPLPCKCRGGFIAPQHVCVDLTYPLS
jgi:hypothetical protein